MPGSGSFHSMTRMNCLPRKLARVIGILLRDIETSGHRSMGGARRHPPPPTMILGGSGLECGGWRADVAPRVLIRPKQPFSRILLVDGDQVLGLARGGPVAGGEGVGEFKGSGDVGELLDAGAARRRAAADGVEGDQEDVADRVDRNPAG